MSAISEDGGIVTAAGEEFFRGFGIELREAGGARRAFCRPCLDWSERRTHLAGALGAALATRSFELGWISRIRDTRALLVTEKGKRGFSETFGIAVARLSLRSHGRVVARSRSVVRRGSTAHASVYDTAAGGSAQGRAGGSRDRGRRL